MPWWPIPVILLSAVLMASWIAYLYTFFQFSKKERIHDLPKGDDYSLRKEKMHALIEEMAAVEPTRRIELYSYDGTRLSARYYHVSDGAPLHIQMHGYRGNGIRDFCGGNKLAREMGHNTLIVDQRAHGKSGGRTICFGLKEQYDCKVWVEFAARYFGMNTPIFLSGVSMGATTVLLAASLPMTANVVGVIADCPFDSPKNIIQKVTADMNLPPKLIYPFISLGALLFGRLRLKGDVAQRINSTRIPICIIHGEADKFVPVEMSRRIRDHSTGPLQLHTFPGAGHGLSFITDEERYKRITQEFMNQCLATAK